VAEEKVEKLKAEETARKMREEEAKKAAEEKKRKEAEIVRLKAEEEQKKKEAADRLAREKELIDAMAEEEASEQAEKDQVITNRIIINIRRSIANEFNKANLPEGLECILRVRLIPGGEVINVSIAQSSGNDIFDRRAESATWKASPLPVPDDKATFERLNLRDNNFTFKPTN
jgi:colicin import membrane protein